MRPGGEPGREGRSEQWDRPGQVCGGRTARTVRRILPCLDEPRGIHIPDAPPEVPTALENERDRMTERVSFLTRNRDAITAYLDAVCTGGA